MYVTVENLDNDFQPGHHRLFVTVKFKLDNAYPYGGMKLDEAARYFAEKLYALQGVHTEGEGL